MLFRGFVEMVALHWQVKTTWVKSLSYLLYQVKLTLYQIIAPDINSSLYIMIMIYNLVLVGTKLNIFNADRSLNVKCTFNKHIFLIHE